MEEEREKGREGHKGNNSSDRMNGICVILMKNRGEGRWMLREYCLMRRRPVHEHKTHFESVSSEIICKRHQCFNIERLSIGYYKLPIFSYL